MKRISGPIGCGAVISAMLWGGCGGGGDGETPSASPFTGVWKMNYPFENYTIVWCVMDGSLFGVDQLGNRYQGEAQGDEAVVSKYRWDADTQSPADATQETLRIRRPADDSIWAKGTFEFVDRPEGPLDAAMKFLYDDEVQGMTGVYQVQFDDGFVDTIRCRVPRRPPHRLLRVRPIPTGAWLSGPAQSAERGRERSWVERIPGPSP